MDYIHVKTLLIEDNPDHADIFHDMLSGIGGGIICDLEQANRLSTGLECLAERDFDAVLLDLSLPDSKGLDTFLRVNLQAPEVPVVVLSALDDEMVAVKTVQAGAQDYLIKGQINSSLLKRSIRYAIERKHADVQLVRNSIHLKDLVKERTAELTKANNLLREEIAERKQVEGQIKKSLGEKEVLLMKDIHRIQKSRQKDLIMMHQSRLAAMGEMIGLIAHQWKQPLNALNILLYNIKDFLYEKGLDDREFDDLMEKGVDLIGRMSTTIDDFRYFFRRSLEKENFCVNKVIKKTLIVLDGNFKYNNISVTVNERDESIVFGFPNEYSQVILNLLGNAKDAVIARGVDGKITIDVLNENNCVVLKVRDNGGGIPEDIMDKIFNPHFTTKEVDKGTGIGLYMSKMIIEEHMGGRISVKNTADGAEFKIVVPVALTDKDQRSSI